MQDIIAKDDPLLMQVLPINNELINPADFQADPVGDLSALTEGCIIHKYQGRVLFITTGTRMQPDTFEVRNTGQVLN
jgi:L-lysine 2,3-aminomutase